MRSSDPRRLVSQCATQRLVVDGDMLDTGVVRLKTAVLYPDGSHVDVFVQSVPLSGRHIVTDLGHTTMRLMDVEIDPWRPRSERFHAAQRVIEALGVEQHHGALQRIVSHADDIPVAVAAVAQASARIGDLALFRARKESQPAPRPLRQILQSAQLSYTLRPLLQGRGSRQIEVDALIRGASRELAVIGLRRRSHGAAADALVRWWDLREATFACVTFIAGPGVLDVDDQARLAETSTLVYENHPEELLRMVAA